MNKIKSVFAYKQIFISFFKTVSGHNLKNRIIFSVISKSVEIREIRKQCRSSGNEFSKKKWMRVGSTKHWNS